MSEELIYITFLHAGIYSIGLYPEELDPENFYFQWQDRTKVQHMYQFKKKGNGDHK